MLEINVLNLTIVVLRETVMPVFVLENDVLVTGQKLKIKSFDSDKATITFQDDNDTTVNGFIFLEITPKIKAAGLDLKLVIEAHMTGETGTGILSVQEPMIDIPNTTLMGTEPATVDVTVTDMSEQPIEGIKFDATKFDFDKSRIDVIVLGLGTTNAQGIVELRITGKTGGLGTTSSLTVQLAETLVEITASATVTITTQASPQPNPVDLAIDGIADPVEESTGGIVVRKFDENNAPRKRIVLTSTDAAGQVTLSRSNNKVRVFDQAEDGEEITFNGTDNVFDALELSSPLFVEGSDPSDSMRDTKLTLTHDNGAADEVYFTVLWVENISAKFRFNQTYSDDNDRADDLAKAFFPQDKKLGIRLEETRICLADEFRGKVKPSDFDRLVSWGRDISSLLWNAGGIRIPPDADFAIIIADKTNFTRPADGPDPLGNDRPSERFRDEDPRHPDEEVAGGNVFMVDCVGPLTTQSGNPPLGRINRQRSNFHSWCAFQDGNLMIRCSPIKFWSVAISWEVVNAAVQLTIDEISQDLKTYTFAGTPLANINVVGGQLSFNSGAPAAGIGFGRMITAQTDSSVTLADTVPGAAEEDDVKIITFSLVDDSQTYAVNTDFNNMGDNKMKVGNGENALIQLGSDMEAP